MIIPLKDLIRKHGIHPKGVFHVGASYAQELEEYKANGVKSTVWVEALPNIFNDLKKIIRLEEDALAFNACISNVDGDEVVFNVASNEGQSSSFLEFGTHSSAHPTVKYISHITLTTKRLDTLINEENLAMNKYDFLNIDLQGAELLALQGLGAYIAGFKYAYIEVNSEQLYVGCPLVEDIDKFLEQFGFVGKETRMTTWGWGDKLYIKY